jgi:hypothetical protein
MAVHRFHSFNQGNCVIKGIVGTDAVEASLKPAVNFTHRANLPRCFALAPLYGHLVTRQVDVKSLNDDGTLAIGAVSAVFTAIDAERWARRFLGDMDRFLAASTSTEIGSQSAPSAMLAKVIDSKQTIASAIAGQLKGVFDYSICETDCDPDFRTGLRAARDTLMEQLQVGLTKGYDIPAIVQRDTDVASAIPQSAETKPAAFGDIHQSALRTPAPLRIQPAPPGLGEQAASPTFDSPNDLQQLSLWTYRVVLAHELAPQDRARITTEFNLMCRPSPAPAPRLDLFDVMAQYMAVADKLWMLLSSTSDPRPGSESSHVNAARTFADLAVMVAAHWSRRLPQDKISGEPESDFVAETSRSFGVRVAYSEHGEAIESVSCTREQPQADPGNMWPEVEVLLPDGSSMALQAQPSGPSSLATVYVPTNGLKVPASAQQTLRLTWRGLNVSAFQNARSRMTVVRNEELVYDPLHPEIATPSTNPAFLFNTAEVVATSVAPLIERNHQQEIKGASLYAALEDAVQKLFPASGLVANTRATWQLDYSYELAGGDTSPSDNPPIRTRIPVALYPDAPLAETARALADAGQGWIDTQQPAFDGAGWLLSVVLHSGLEAGSRPLFRADLFYGIAKPASDHARR